MDDKITATAAYRLAARRTALLWRGDFHNARQLLAAMARRLPDGPVRSFADHRERQSHRARVLGRLLIPIEPGYVVPLRRAPDVRQACLDAYGPLDQPAAIPLRDLLGLIGAHQWRLRGVPVAALDGRIHPHFGVFAPVRGEYVDLVAAMPLPQATSAIDLGTGTGVLAAVLARRGVARVIASDVDPRALACARDNLERLGLADRVEVVRADLYPPGRADLVVCNPPWLPGEPISALDHAVYDPGSRMLRGFLDGLGERGGEGRLILSDLAEHLGLRSRQELLEWIADAGLRVADRRDTRPRHPRSGNPHDPLHAARSAEIVSLWRLLPR
ncbi:methyltransferase [Kribbella deserti]|uniref:Methyltransferase n=1 Tax=Kribbella deserti TaxID=1926257 RepID=A0ABV6QUS7_9ACTN